MHSQPINVGSVTWASGPHTTYKMLLYVMPLTFCVWGLAHWGLGGDFLYCGFGQCHFVIGVFVWYPLVQTLMPSEHDLRGVHVIIIHPSETGLSFLR